MIDKTPKFAEGVFEHPLRSDDLVVSTITSGFCNFEAAHPGEVNVMKEPFNVHRIDRRISHKIIFDPDFLLTDLLVDSDILREWLRILPNVTIIDGISKAITENIIEDGTYLASCGHHVPIDMFLTAIKLFMTSCMKIAMGKKLASVF